MASLSLCRLVRSSSNQNISTAAFHRVSISSMRNRRLVSDTWSPLSLPTGAAGTDAKFSTAAGWCRLTRTLTSCCCSILHNGMLLDWQRWIGAGFKCKGFHVMTLQPKHHETCSAASCGNGKFLVLNAAGAIVWHARMIWVPMRLLV